MLAMIASTWSLEHSRCQKVYQQPANIPCGVIRVSVFSSCPGYNVPTAEGSKFMLKISSIFNSSLKPLLPEIGVVRLFDNKRVC